MRIVLVVAIVAAGRLAHADPGGPGVLSVGGTAARVDAAFEHAINSDGVALIPGARVAFGNGGFLDAELPLGWQDQAGALALGDATLRAGYRPSSGRLAAISLRLSAPTAPAVGGGAKTALALATPRVADGELFLPDTTSLELVADWRWNRTTWWLQAEAGAAEWWQPDRRADTVLRASFAGGVPVEPWLDLTTSLVTRSFLLAHGAPENFLHTFALGIVTHTSRGEIALRLEVPIDKSARDDDRFVVGLEIRGR